MKCTHVIFRMLIILMLWTMCLVGAAKADENAVMAFTPLEVQQALEDESFQGTIVVGANLNLTEGQYGIIEVEGDRTVTLDLNGHTLEGEGIDNHTNLFLIDSVGDGALVLKKMGIYNYGTLSIDGANVIGKGSSCTITNYWDGSFFLISGCVSADKKSCALSNSGGICIINNGTIKGTTAIESRHGIQLNPIYGYDEKGSLVGATGLRWRDGAITINGGVIEGDVQISNTEVVISGGTIRGDVGGVEYHNLTGELIVLPLPTYELHEDNGEMKQGYWDVPMNAWFYAPVQTMMDNGTLGYGEDGNFGPTEPLTRGQAAALLVRACGAETAEEVAEPPFLDVSAATPHAKYINAGKGLGFLSGDGQEQFYPESTITRQEFAVLVMNAVHKYGLELPPEVSGVAFQDEDAIAPWAKDAVAEGAGYGLWNGTGSGDFLPLNPITRAEGATILARLIKVMDINPNEI